jgi:hypothetical protein
MIHDIVEALLRLAKKALAQACNLRDQVLYSGDWVGINNKTSSLGILLCATILLLQNTCVRETGAYEGQSEANAQRRVARKKKES